jgi:hypothetical protein
MELFRTDRPLRMWDYSATHSILFLVGQGLNRVELTFGMTAAFKLGCFMPSLLVRDPHEHELSVLSAETGLRLVGPITGSSRLFVMETGERVGWVLAQEMLAYETGITAETYYQPDVWNRKVPADAVFVNKHRVSTWGLRGTWGLLGT